MNVRPIDANALMERLTRKKADVANQRYTEGFNDALLKFRSMLHGEPTLDYAPVRHGEWIMVSPDGTFGVCNDCNRSDYIDPLATHCRYCGAKMDGGKEDV